MGLAGLKEKQSDVKQWTKGSWSLLLKESGELLLIDHIQLTTISVVRDNLSNEKLEQKIDCLLANAKDTTPWNFKHLLLTCCKN